jgi:hypothetical protein
MKYRSFLTLLLVLPIFIQSCIEPFSPPEIALTERALVIDGYLNLNGYESTISLSRTGTLSEYIRNYKESLAQVTAENEQGEKYPFVEEELGTYKLQPLMLSTTLKYRLHIKTADGKEYLSKWVEPRIAPEIDAITYKYDPNRDAVVISVNTHDPANNTKFYRWTFQQTYQYSSAFYSGLEHEVDEETEEVSIVQRKENINVCWKTLSSTNISLGSTVKLSSDIIQEMPINIVPVSTNYFRQKYSILVRQSALSEEGFRYWTSLSKSTQGTGTLFDPQPSQVTGNFTNTSDPKELVFGYFSAGAESSKRIFINEALGRYPSCNGPDTLTLAEAKEFNGYLLSYDNSGGFVYASDAYCADCRVQGGTIVKPSFWE